MGTMFQHWWLCVLTREGRNTWACPCGARHWVGLGVQGSPVVPVPTKVWDPQPLHTRTHQPDEEDTLGPPDKETLSIPDNCEGHRASSQLLLQMRQQMRAVR